MKFDFEISRGDCVLVSVTVNLWGKIGGFNIKISINIVKMTNNKTFFSIIF